MQYCRGLILVLTLCCSTPSVAEPLHRIERLLSEEWEIAGYVGTFDSRSTVILFRKKGVNFLVQCSTLYDVTRSQRVVTNCYELH